MRLLASGSGNDIPIVGGESGVAGLAGLLSLTSLSELRQQAGLNADARVLLINTEGATAPSIYEELVGNSAGQVLSRQKLWLDIATKG